MAQHLKKKTIQKPEARNESDDHWKHPAYISECQMLFLLKVLEKTRNEKGHYKVMPTTTNLTESC